MLTFELAEFQPGIKVVGVNIAYKQLVSAENYLCRRSKINSILFSKQDYHYLAFPDAAFDVVIFCESYIHSCDKRQLAQKIYRVLKPTGKIAISDTLLEIDPINENEKTVLLYLKEGWYLSSILKTKELRTICKKVGFSNISFESYTRNIINSSRRMREHAELRIRQGNAGLEVLKLTRNTTIACTESL